MSIIPAIDLLRHLRPIRSKETGAILVLESYFDDSGTHASSQISVWAGFVAAEKQWTDLDAEWRALLKHDDFKLTYFHMYDVVHGINECARWEQERRDWCVGQFKKLILKHGLLDIGNTSIRKDWSEIIIPSKLFLELGLSACIPIAKHHVANKGEEQITFVFDDRQRRQPAIDSVINYYKNDRKKPNIAAVSFLEMKNYTGLQAADMLAWETYNYSLQCLEAGTYPDGNYMESKFI